jgi:hypothetical protein
MTGAFRFLSVGNLTAHRTIFKAHVAVCWSDNWQGKPEYLEETCLDETPRAPTLVRTLSAQRHFGPFTHSLQANFASLIFSNSAFGEALDGM